METKFNFEIIAPNYLCTCAEGKTLCEKINANTAISLDERQKKTVLAFCQNVRNENETLNLGPVTVVSRIRGKRS